MTCTVEDRDRVREAAELLGDDPRVAATALVPPDDDPTNQWALELVLEDDRVRPPILRALALQELTLRPEVTGTRGEPTQTVVVATA